MRYFMMAVCLCLMIFAGEARAATSLTLGSPSPRSAIVDTAIQLSAVFGGEAGVAGCDLYVNKQKVKSMTVKDTVAIVSYTFPDVATYETYVKCTDLAGEVVSSPIIGVDVGTGTPNAKPGDRIKMSCPSEVMVNDPCTTVYFYGVDGRRHAFPNEAVYKQWFKNFDGLVIVSPEVMASIMLGRMVTHRPGYALVKFSTNTVYAVSYSGVLRPIATEEIARALFGATWTSTVVDVSDAFYSQYRTGRLIDSTRDYELSKVKASADSVNDIL